MNLRLLTWLIALAAWALAGSASSALAQGAASRNVDEVLAGQRVKMLAGLLQLTDEQKTKIHPIVVEEFKAARAAKEDEKMSIQEKFAKTDAVHADAKVKIKAQLTPEQLTKWAELEQKSTKKPKS